MPLNVRAKVNSEIIYSRCVGNKNTDYNNQSQCVLWCMVVMQIVFGVDRHFTPMSCNRPLFFFIQLQFFCRSYFRSHREQVILWPNFVGIVIYICGQNYITGLPSVVVLLSLLRLRCRYNLHCRCSDIVDTRQFAKMW